MPGTCSLGGRRRSRRMRGGNGYGMGNNPIAVGAAEWTPNMTSVPGGAAYTPKGGRRKTNRRRRSRGRRRRMRGGGSAANVGASFQGDGARGMQNYSAYAANTPTGLVPGGSNGAY